MSNIFSSSIGKKLLMSLMGLFLIAFLLVHMGLNLLLIFSDSFESFNKAAHFMATNPIIKLMEIVLFGGFLLHMFYGTVLIIQNMISRPVGYKVPNTAELSFFSKYVFHTAVVITVFLVLHLFDFYIKAKFIGDVGEVIYNGEPYHDMGTLVFERFQMLGVVVFYLIALLFLGFHLHHGFQSAFQTLGFNHPIYTPIIKSIGVIYTLVVTIGFMSIPIVIYFFK